MRHPQYFNAKLSNCLIDERLACIDALLARPSLDPARRDRLQHIRALLAEDMRLRRGEPSPRLERVETLLRWSDRGADIGHMVAG